MKLIVGLGNPGEKYLKNRHNVGFMFVDYFAQKLNSSSFKFDKYMQAEVAESDGYVFAKPQTFMNLSGVSVKKIATKHEIKDMNNVFVTHDDLDIPLGKFKIQKSTGPKLHNGLDSIDSMLGSKDYYRIRIGVENRGDSRIPGEAYVLQNFTEEEKNRLHNIFKEIEERLKLTLKED